MENMRKHPTIQPNLTNNFDFMVDISTLHDFMGGKLTPATVPKHHWGTAFPRLIQSNQCRIEVFTSTIQHSLLQPCQPILTHMSYGQYSWLITINRG